MPICCAVFQFSEMVSTKQMLKLPQVKVELLTPALEEVTSINMATQALLVLDWLRKFMVDENVSLEESTEKVGQRRPWAAAGRRLVHAPGKPLYGPLCRVCCTACVRSGV